MKINSRALAYISIFVGVSPAASKCLSGSFILEYEGDCDRETLVAVFKDQVFDVEGAKTAACDGVTAEQELDAQLAEASTNTTIEALCSGIYKDQSEVPFTDILKKGDNMEYEQAFYNGFTQLQEETETTYERDDRQATSVLKSDGELVRVHYQGKAQSSKTQWPALPNFKSSVTDSSGGATCTTNAAMCCWPRDRQARDNNGNCAANTYSQNCVDKDPGDNTNLCFVDQDRGAAATGISGEGLVTFPDDEEGAIHCHGLAWANDPTDASARYKGNNLFFVSMFDHMYQRGYVENIPGAPMCGCVEQMPTVTRSDCTEIDVTERFKITYNEETNAVDGAITLIDVDFNACQGINRRNNDLYAYLGQLYYDGKITNKQWGEAGRIITNGGCKEATRVQYGDMGLKYGYDHALDIFTFVAGREEMKVDETYGHRAFHAAMFEYSLTAPSNSSATPLDSTPILLRVCPECRETHKKVYYRRLTPVPDNVDLLHCLVHRRDKCDGQNVWKQDFTLHSTYEDAVAGINDWSCPNDSFNYGAPYDGECSPSGARVKNQWTVLHWSAPPQRQMAFYVNKPQDHAIKEVGIDVNDDPVRIQSTSTASEYISEDVGNDVRIPGKVRLDDNGDIYMTASGANIWHANDNFHYYYKDVEGDFDVTVNVKSFDNIVNSNAKVGIMFRSSLEPDSAYVQAILSGGKGLRFQARSSRGNGSFNAGTFEPNPSRKNVWLRLVKVSAKVEMYWSEDGNDWILGGEATIFFPNDSFKLGLALCSHDANSQSEATLADFIVNRYNFPSASPSISAAPTSWDPDFNIGETKENGLQVNPLSETQTQVKYYPGAGIDGHTDSFYYHAFQRPSNMPFEVVVSVDYFHASAGAKGGVMIRDNIGASASNAFIGIHPQASTGVIVQSRETDGGDTVRHKSLWVPNNKAFVKLSYDGIDTVTSYYKEVEEDPWTAVENGSAKITITGDTVVAGVAVTGGGIDKYVDFRYSNFEIADL